MSSVQVLLLLAYVAGLVGGQLLFKAVAGRAAFTSASAFIQIALDPMFIGAVLLYGALSIFWVWLLSFTPLSRAYPFVALALVAAPLLASIVFGEQLTLRLILGTALVVLGVAVTTT